MRNPLKRRIPRILKTDWKKYLVLFGLLAIMIGSISGMYVANGSMERAASEAFEKYNIEDGHFELKHEAAEGLLNAYRDRGIRIVPQYYKDLSEDHDRDGSEDSVLRIFQMRDDMNRASLMEGAFPESADEIVIDRMHAANCGIACGDVISIGGKSVKVCGLVAFSDYSALYKDNSDMMFDALTFDIGAMTADGFEALEAESVWQYAYQFDDRPVTDAQKKEKSDELVEKLAVLALTGGVLDDADEAQAKKDDLEARGEALEAEGDELQAQADALEAEGEELQRKADRLEEDAADLTENIVGALVAAGVPVSAETAGAGEGELEIPEELLALIPADMRTKMRDLKEQGEELEKQGEDLEERGESLKLAGDELQERADALEAEADALVNKELENELTDYVPEYANQAIHFAVEDFGTDKAMSEVMGNIMVIVIAFIFAITQNNTITNEAAVIGTLRASGYTRGELLLHYLSLPVLVTLLAAAIGNVLGYTCLKEAVVDMYYNSYSLPTYETHWNADAFMRTTLIPIVIILFINFVVIHTKLKISPLKFLRHDLSRGKKKHALKLPEVSFLQRFRMRIFLQNLAGYGVLFAGIFFVMIMLCFSVGMPVTLRDYQDHASEYVVAPFQYILTDTEDEDGVAVSTSAPGAERFCINSMKTAGGVHEGEDITVYGYCADSAYFRLPYELAEGKAYISSPYSEKFGIGTGDSITLKDKYTDKRYDFEVAGIYALPGSMAVLVPDYEFNRIFDLDEGSFSGFLCAEKITDIEEDRIAACITVDDALKMANQLDHSIGSYMTYFVYVCFILAMLIIYLLTKLIIEQNAGNISMVKVLGYTDGEIAGLYVLLTSVVVVISAAITAFLSYMAVVEIWKAMLVRMNGYIIFNMHPQQFVQIILTVIAAYILVAFVDLLRIRRIPLTDALKNVE
ncbi:MAG: hypothetical protein IK115_08495 [Lachnospiraceae bacterium]|nr:hypothetical protein [Lachnospiraceae bacterium]